MIIVKPKSKSKSKVKSKVKESQKSKVKSQRTWTLLTVLSLLYHHTTTTTTDRGLLDKIPDDQLKSNMSKKRPLFGLTLSTPVQFSQNICYVRLKEAGKQKTYSKAMQWLRNRMIFAFHLSSEYQYQYEIFCVVLSLAGFLTNVYGECDRRRTDRQRNFCNS